MAIDTSIYRNINPLAIQSPLELAAQGAQVQGAQQQNRLAQMQLQQAERTNAQQDAVNSAYAAGLDPTTGQIDQSKVIGSLGQSGFGSAIPGVQKSFTDTAKSQAEAGAAQIKMAADRADLVGRGMQAAKENPSLYPQILATLKQQIPGGGADLPEQYDPAIVDSVISQAMSVKDRADQQLKQQGYELNVRQQTETERNNRTQNSISAANLSVAQQGLGLRRQELAQNGGAKAPTGYRFTADGKNLEAIPGGPGVKDKAPTEFQGKSGTFGARAEQSDKILKELEGNYSVAGLRAQQGAAATPLIGGALGALGNTVLSENQQRVDQAERDFVNATLRQESGAAISDGEFNNARKQYFPQPGDSAAVIRQKAQNRSAVIEGFKRNAGPAAYTATQSRTDQPITNSNVFDAADAIINGGR